MFTSGQSARFNSPLSRREFLKIGALGANGLALPQLFRAEGAMHTCSPLYNNHDYSGSTGKTSAQKGSATTVASSASPEVIGSDSGGGGDKDDGGGGDSDGGSDGGGDDEPPTIVSSSDDPFNWFVWLILSICQCVFRLARLSSSAISTVCKAIRACFNQVPDLIETMRLFRTVFTHNIRDRLYTPAVNDLVREMSRARSCEWEVGVMRRCWEWVWWRVRFWYVVVRCFAAWVCEMAAIRRVFKENPPPSHDE